MATKVAKRYHFSDINIKLVANKKVLEDAKRIHLDLKKIHNTGTL